MLSETMRMRVLKLDAITDETKLKMLDSAINAAYEAEVMARKEDTEPDPIPKGKLQ